MDTEDLRGTMPRLPGSAKRAQQESNHDTVDFA